MSFFCVRAWDYGVIRGFFVVEVCGNAGVGFCKEER